jgi:hypothetical protein
MSRYSIQADKVGYHIELGWDNALQTFWAQVYQPALVGPQEDQHPCLWVGTAVGELPTLAALEEVLEGYVRLSEELKGRLTEDYAQRTPPAPLQVQMHTLLARSTPPRDGIRKEA